MNDANGLTIVEQLIADFRGVLRAGLLGRFGLFALRSVPLAVCLLVGGVSLHAQNANSPHEGLCAELSTTPGNVSVRWWGKAGRTYFVQTSTTLLPDSWSYLPTVEGGADALKSIGMAAPSDKLFVRLVYTDAAYTGDVGAADADGDGLSNALEVSLAIRSNPLVPDTDGDGHSDGVEHQYGFSPTLASSNPESVAGTRYLETTSASFSARHVVSRPQAGVDFWFRKKTYYGMPGYTSQPQENFTNERPSFPPIPPLPEFNSLSFGAWTAFSSDINPVALGDDYHTNIGEVEQADYSYIWSKMRIRAAAPSLRDRHYWLLLSHNTPGGPTTGREFRHVVMPAGAVTAEEPVKVNKLNDAQKEIQGGAVLEFEVAGRGQRGDFVPSVNGSAGEVHYVTPKWAQDIDGNNYKTVIVEAKGLSQYDFSGTNAKYQWSCISEATGASAGAPDTTDASKFVLNRETPDHFTLSVVPTNATNGVTGKIHVWVVWADPPQITDASAVFGDWWGMLLGNSTVIGKKWACIANRKFKYVIKPATIITAPERPDLEGEKTHNPPGHTKPYAAKKDTVPDTASLKWDVSRQVKLTIRNPNGISEVSLKSVADGTMFDGQPKPVSIINYPTDPAEGNDDPENDQTEDSNPYQASNTNDLVHQIGEMTSLDAPSFYVGTFWAATGSSFDIEANFREFCRLEIHDGARTTGRFWFRISNFTDWHHYMETIRGTTDWEDTYSSSGQTHPSP